MTDTFVEEKLNKLLEVNGIRVYNINSSRFKTNTINIFLQDNLNKDTVTMNALFPSVLRRGCQGLPTLKDISLYLEELYGAVFDCGVVKKGERQILHFFLEYISDQYASGEEHNFKRGLEFILKILYKPVLEGDSFVSEYVEQEKNNLKTLIEGRTNDKVQYSMDRCYELMCSDEPFGVYEYGTVSQVESITAKELYQHYHKKIRALPMDIFITGEISESNRVFLKESLMAVDRGPVQSLTTGIIHKHADGVRYFEDKMDVNQGKLSLGFRTHVTPSEDAYYALLVYNGILGSGMHSKLFQNVREKAGLAYYIFAGLEKFKGLMIIGSGIDEKEKDRAEKIIMEQLEDMKAGKISDYEYDATMRSIETGINALKDSQLQVVDFYLSQLIADTHDTLDGIMSKLKKVSRQNIIDVSKKIQLDTIYFLRSDKE